MIARKVYESFSFERGQNPKDALGIGLEAKAFPIIAIRGVNSPWKRGEEIRVYFESILKSGGGIPYYKEIYIEKDPKFTKVISKTWDVYEIRRQGYSGLKWADIFVPFSVRKGESQMDESIEFQRGLDPKQALNIGRIQEIQRWIKFFDLDGRSDIVGLNVIVNGGITFSKFGPNPDAPDMPTTFPMDGLIIKGSFYMDRSDFTELPKSLTVQGPLDLTYYKGTELPENLIVTGNLVLVNPQNPLVIQDNARIDGFIKLEKEDLAMISVPDHLRDLLYFTDEAKKFYESVNFQRGGDIYKSIGIGRIRPYPQMSPEEFKKWYIEEIESYLDMDQISGIADNLVSNEWEPDWEVSKFLSKRGIPRDIIEELMPMREYFNDMKYYGILGFDLI